MSGEAPGAVVDAVDTRGVSASWLLSTPVRPALESAVSVAVGVADVLLPLTQGKGSVAEVLARQGGPSLVADTATVFVSYSWQNSWEKILSTLERELGGEAEETFLWMDVLCVDQSKAKTFSTEFWTVAFHSAIRKIGTTLLVLSPWKRPIALQRSWCLWEVLGTILVQEGKLIPAIAPDEARSFRETLVNDLDTIVAGLGAVDARHAQAALPSDQRMIQDAIESSIGFNKLNEHVVGAIRGWIVNQALQAVDDVQRQDQSGDSKQTLAVLMNRTALILSELGRFVEARKLLEHAVALVDQVGTTRNRAEMRLDLAGCISNWPDQLHLAIEMAQGAAQLLEKCTDADSSLAFALHLIGGFTLDRLVQSQISAQDLAPARAAMERCAVIRRRLGSSEAGSLASTLTNLGELHRELGDFGKAQSLCREAHQLALAEFGPSHPRTAYMLHNVAIMLLVQGKKSEACATREQAMGIFHHVYGEDNTDAVPRKECDKLWKRVQSKLGGGAEAL